MPKTKQQSSQVKKKLIRARKKLVQGKGSYRVSGAPNVIYGQGGFWGDAWNSGRKYIPRALGGAAGYLAGGPAGAARGWGAGGDFSRTVLGWGDYGIPWKVENNTLVTESGVPSMHDTGDSGFRIQHKEFLGPVFSSTSFNPNTYAVNPGLWATFPWISVIAANFQQYKLLGALVVFEPVLPDGMASFASLGSVMIAAQMNPAAPAFTSEIQMMQTKFVVARKPTVPIAAPIECSPLSGPGSNNLLVRTAAVPANQVVNNYDHCKFTVATNGQPSSGVMIGKVWFTTDLLFLNPISGQGLGVWGARYVLNGVDNSHPLGTSTTKSYDDFGITISTSAKTVTFPVGIVGKIRLIIAYTTSSGQVTLPAILITNATVVPSGSWWAPDTGETATRAIESNVYNITDSNTAFVLTFGNSTTGAVSSATLMLEDVSSSFA